jgi:hypothetical protein
VILANALWLVTFAAVIVGGAALCLVGLMFIDEDGV